MKKTILLAALALGAMSASAQSIEQPKFFDNWSFGLEGGVTTPMHGHARVKSTRGIVGAHLQKQITPAFAMGAEGQFGINTSSWGPRKSKTAFDNTYVGLYGAVDLFNLFGGYNCEVRPFTIEAQVGGGWLHSYGTHTNDFGTKLGVNFNYNVNDDVTLSLRPSLIYNLTGRAMGDKQFAFDSNRAALVLEAGVAYHFGGQKFTCVQPYNQAEVDYLNGQINDLRASLDAAVANGTAWEAKANGLANELQACLSRPVQKEVVKEVNNNLNSVRYVFFRIGSSVITADQQPNVEMIAAYMKNHKDSKVVIKGYASPDGPLEVNIRLAKARAEAVKTSLVKKYKIAADRITAEGEGIGNMFTEESWNRVSICTIEDAK